MAGRSAPDRQNDWCPAGERDTLTGYLCDYRRTLELKCSGLDAAGMACRSVPPSNLSLLGLVRHLTDVERTWFRRVGRQPPRRHAGPDCLDRRLAKAKPVGGNTAIAA